MYINVKYSTVKHFFVKPHHYTLQIQMQRNAHLQSRISHAVLFYRFATVEFWNYLKTSLYKLKIFVTLI